MLVHVAKCTPFSGTVVWWGRGTLSSASDKWNTMIDSQRFRYEWDLPFCLNINAIQHAMTYGSFNRGLKLAFSVRMALGLVRVATKLSMIQNDIVVHTTTTSSSHHHSFIIHHNNNYKTVIHLYIYFLVCFKIHYYYKRLRMATTQHYILIITSREEHIG